MSDAKRKAEQPFGDAAAKEVDPTFRPPGSDEAEQSPSEAAAATAINQTPAAHTEPGNVGANRAEEHGAPAPTTRIGTKLWILAGLVAVIVIAAIWSGTV